MDDYVLDLVEFTLIACLPPAIYLRFVLSVYKIANRIVGLNFKVSAFPLVVLVKRYKLLVHIRTAKEHC